MTGLEAITLLKQHRPVKTDVLVVGGGAAACRAAIEAEEQGVQVLMVVKQTLGSGATQRCKGTGISAAFEPHDHPEEFLRNIMDTGLGMCDENLARILAYEAQKRVLELEEWGMEFLKRGKHFSRVQGCFQTHPWACLSMQSLIPVLKDEIKRRDVELMERIMVTNLITHHGTCVGAVGIDNEGEFIVFQAKSTIIATGGAGQLYLLNWHTGELTGDGYVMAYEAGAELMNMEFMQLGCSTVFPPLPYPPPDQRIWTLHPDIYNAEGERFLQKYLPEGVSLENCFDIRATHFPFSARDDSKYIDIAIHKEIIEERGTQHRGVYLDITKRPKREIEAFNKEWGTNIKGYGSEIQTKPVEFAPFVHAFNGGIKINERAETTLSGLYAAGEVAAGPHGADRLGGNMQAACMVFGARTGAYAANRAKKMGVPAMNWSQVEEEHQYISRLTENEPTIKIDDLMQEIQETMWTNALVVRNEEGLNEAIKTLEMCREQTACGLSAKKGEGLIQAVTLKNLIQVGIMICKVALMRKETRGSHYREDYPYKDDRRWSSMITIKKERENMTPSFQASLSRCSWHTSSAED